MYLRTYVRKKVRTYLRTYVRTYVHTYVPTYLRTYVCVYPRVYLSDALLFAALARAAEWRVGELSSQDLANTAWAFPTAGVT